MPQASLADYVQFLNKAGLLTRISEEMRVDKLPMLMAANPDTAILVEHREDCAFPFFANGYGVRLMYALSLECDETKADLEYSRGSEQRFKPEMVETAPCKDVDGNLQYAVGRPHWPAQKVLGNRQTASAFT